MQLPKNPKAPVVKKEIAASRGEQSYLAGSLFRRASAASRSDVTSLGTSAEPLWWKEDGVGVRVSSTYRARSWIVVLAVRSRSCSGIFYFRRIIFSRRIPFREVQPKLCKESVVDTLVILSTSHHIL